MGAAGALRAGEKLRNAAQALGLRPWLAALPLRERRLRARLLMSAPKVGKVNGPFGRHRAINGPFGCDHRYSCIAGSRGTTRAKGDNLQNGNRHQIALNRRCRP